MTREPGVGVAWPDASPPGLSILRMLDDECLKGFFKSVTEEEEGGRVAGNR